MSWFLCDAGSFLILSQHRLLEGCRGSFLMRPLLFSPQHRLLERCRGSFLMRAFVSFHPNPLNGKDVLGLVEPPDSSLTAEPLLPGSPTSRVSRLLEVFDRLHKAGFYIFSAEPVNSVAVGHASFVGRVFLM